LYRSAGGKAELTVGQGAETVERGATLKILETHCLAELARGDFDAIDEEDAEEEGPEGLEVNVSLRGKKSKV